MQRFPIGISNFRFIRQENYMYIDKTLYIEKLENARKQSIHFLRPARFGKTLFTSMLDAYYDVNSADEFKLLFQGTYIYEHPTKEKNSYYILRFDFSGFNIDHSKVSEIEIADRVYDSCSEFLNRYHIKLELEKRSAAGILSQLLSMIDVKPLYVMIDEFDFIANELLSFRFNDFHDAVSKNAYIRKFYEVLKTGTTDSTIGKIFITGVSPITLDSMTSGFNISTNLSLDPRFNEMMGFTKDEMKHLISMVKEIDNHDQVLEKMKCIYDGYMFSKEGKYHVFNPNMSLYYLDYIQSFHKPPEEIIDPNIYSDYKKIENLLSIKPDPSQQLVIADILSEQTLKCKLTATYEISSQFTKDDFVSLLYYLGYLTICGAIGPRVLLKVPNEVMKNVYFDYFRSMLQTYDDISTEKDLDAIDNILYEKDNTLFVKQVETILEVLDKRDYMKFDEGRLKIACAAVCRSNSSVLFKSEYPVPNGFIDFVLFPYQVEGATALVELKYIKAKDLSTSLLEEKRQSALAELRKYETAREFQNIDIVKWILIFSKDKCLLNEKVDS